jgi:hypothetical protein
MPAFVMERFGHKETIYGETAGKAKYQAWLDSESGYDFPDFLKTIYSCRKDKYASRMQQQQEKSDLKFGDRVVMHTCPEAAIHRGRVFNVVSNPWDLCGSEVVLLEGYRGGFATQFLRKVD